MSILALRDIQGIAAFSNEIRIPSGNSLNVVGTATVGTLNVSNAASFPTVTATNLRATNIQNSSGVAALQIDASGRVTNSANPMFAARGSEANFTLTNQSDLPFNNAFFNVGGHFNTGSGRFTCPVTGTYLFTVSLFNNGGGGRLSIKVNGGSYQNMQTQYNTSTCWSASVIWRLNANDYVTVGDWQNTSGGVIYMGHSHFCGYLLG
jgi:hypothetical protein